MIIKESMFVKAQLNSTHDENPILRGRDRDSDTTEPFAKAVGKLTSQAQSDL
jgi:hypothetical protein